MRIHFKVILFLILSYWCALPAHSQAPVLELKMKNATLKEIVNQMEKKSDYTFVFNEKLDMQQRKNISIHDQPISEALNQVFVGTGIDWKLINNHIVLGKAKNITISGYITEAKSMETLIGATVTDIKTGVSSFSNSYGYYTIQVNADSVKLQASYIGFKKVTKAFVVKKDTIINFQLQDSNTELNSVVVYKNENTIKAGSAIELSSSDIKSTASSLGEKDLMKTLQTIPGISNGFEGSGGIIVRGGTPDQNLILVDGAPLYNTGHQLNIFSVINGDAIKKVSMYKNNFPARFGGRLSSVMDIRLKDGDMQNYHADATLGLYTARINLEGPIIKGKTSFSFSTRRSYLDVYQRVIINSDGNESVNYLYDINAKVNHKFSEKSRLYFSYYSGRDKQYDDIYYTSYSNLSSRSTHKNKYSWGNDILSLRWNYIFNNKLFMNTSLTYNRYSYYNNQAENNTYKDISKYSYSFRKSGIKDWQSAVDLEYQLNNSHYIRFGTALIFHQFSPEINGSGIKDIGSNNENWILKYYLHEKMQGKEASVYGEDEFSVTDKLKTNYGLHLSMFHIQGKTYLGFEPRLSLTYQLSSKLIAKIAYSKMNQYVNLLSSNIAVNEPTDLWVPITKNLKPMISHQVSGGIFFDAKNGYNFSAEAFYKRMNNVLEYKDGMVWKDVFSSWDENIESGRAWIYGMELSAQKTQGKFTTSIAYTLSWNNRQFSNINNGLKFNSRYDSRHNLVIRTSFNLNRKIDISASWVYMTGLRCTLPLEEYELLPSVDQGYYSSTVNHVGQRNNYKLSDTHHLDIDVRYQYSDRKMWNFGIYNIYNRHNPYTLNLYYSRGSNITEKALFGIMPTVSYTYKFR